MKDLGVFRDTLQLSQVDSLMSWFRAVFEENFGWLLFGHHFKYLSNSV